MKNKTMTYWNIPVSKSLDDGLEEAVKKGGYASKSEFVRDAVRRMLEKMGFQERIVIT